MEERKSNNFPSWENPPKVSDLRNDQTQAQSASDVHHTEVAEWLDLLNITGKEKVITPAGRSQVQPKTIRKQNEWRYPALSEPFMSTPELFDVTPITYDDRQSAIQNALVLNNQVETKIGKSSFIDTYIRTGVDEGTVIVRNGWKFEQEAVEVPEFEYVPVENQQQMQRLQQLMQKYQEDPITFKNTMPKEATQAIELSMQMQQPIVARPTGNMIEEMKTIHNHPTWDVCDYENIVIDPTCEGDIRKAQFIIHSYETSLSDLERSGRYSNLKKIPENAASGGIDDYRDSYDHSFRFNDKPRQKLVVNEYWGYWDINGTGITQPIVCEYVGDVMIRMDENPFADKELPFTLVQMLPRRRNTFGETDASLIGDNQRIIGAVMRGNIDVLARSANGQSGYAKGAFDVTNKRKFKAGEDYEFNPSMSPDQAFHMHKYPELPQSSMQVMQLMQSDAEAVTGVRPFSQSQTGSIGADTATGVKSANDATSKRDTAILRRFAEGIKELGRKTISMNQQFLGEDEVIRITNEEFVQVRQDDLAGNFDLRIDISTAEEDNSKAQELAFMMQTIGNNMPPGMQNMILSEIATLRKMPTLAKRLAEFKPEPDPMQEKLQQLEMAKLEAEVAKLQSEAAENQAQGQLDIAKAESERAKARQLGSTADLQNLDYLEQESGTKHDRELQKASQQSKAQAKTKMIEAQLKREENDNNRDMDRRDNFINKERDHQLSREAAREDALMKAVADSKNASDKKPQSK